MTNGRVNRITGVPGGQGFLLAQNLHHSWAGAERVAGGTIVVLGDANVAALISANLNNRFLFENLLRVDAIAPPPVVHYRFEDGPAAAAIPVLKDSGPLGSLRSLLDQQGQGRSNVLLNLNLSDTGQEVEVALPGSFAITARTRGAIKAISGVVDVHDL